MKCEKPVVPSSTNTTTSSTSSSAVITSTTSTSDPSVSVSSVFASALNGTHHYHTICNSPPVEHFYNTLHAANQPNNQNTVTNHEKWKSEGFLERVMIKVRRRESYEMAIRIVEEIAIPSLRKIVKARILYKGPTPLSLLLQEFKDRKGELIKNKAQLIQDFVKARIDQKGSCSSSSSSLNISAITHSNNMSFDDEFLISDIITTWLNEITEHDVPKMIEDYFATHNIELKYASKESLVPPLITALTEDIYELEILQAKTSFITLRKLKRQKELLLLKNKIKLSEENNNILASNLNNQDHNNNNKTTAHGGSKYTVTSAPGSDEDIETIERELDQMIKDDKKHEIDDHGDRVYEMMVARYGIGSVDVIETPESLQGGRPNFILHAKNESENDGLNMNNMTMSHVFSHSFHTMEEIIKKWDRKYLMGQSLYIIAIAVVLILIFNGLMKSSSEFISGFFPAFF